MSQPDEQGPNEHRPAEEQGASFEASRDELALVVQRLEAGGLPLENSLALWQRGEELAAICQQLLDQAREQVRQGLGQQAREEGQGAIDGADPSDGY